MDTLISGPDSICTEQFTIFRYECKQNSLGTQKSIILGVLLFSLDVRLSWKCTAYAALHQRPLEIGHLENHTVMAK